MRNRHAALGRTWAVGAIVTAVLATAACASGTSTSTTKGVAADASRACEQNVPASTTQTDKVLTIGREGNTSFTRNFNPFSPNALWPTAFAMYDSLFVYDRGNGKTIPRLATQWTINPQATSAEFTVRPGVKWSDGKPFTADDVAFTFQEQRKVFGAGMFDFVKSVTAKGDKVVFSFGRSYSPGLYELGTMLIVPKHVWQDVKDPATFTNQKPVATGPFTEVSDFKAQAYQVDRNPNYWEQGKPYITGVRVPAFPTNDQVQLALANGEIDWADVFVPDIGKTYVKSDPRRCYWFPPMGGTVNLYVNNAKKPFDDQNVRKAISMAVNRAQILSVAMNDYAALPDTSGISPRYATWKNTQPSGDNWTKLNLAKANELLDAAGLKKNSSGVRTMADGTPLNWTIKVGSASTDWTASSKVIAQNLKAVGLDVKVQAQDWGAVIDQASKGDFTMAHMWSSEGVTPFNFYRGAMSSATFKPVGEATNENYQRFKDPKADELLKQFAATSDRAKQEEIIGKLGQLYADLAPAIPLFYGPEFGEYNTTRFVGFPTKENPFADPNTRSATAAIVLSNIRSR